MSIPDKCGGCEHTIIRFENVHRGWCKFEYEMMVRCGRDPLQHPCGCRCAEMYCDRKESA